MLRARAAPFPFLCPTETRSLLARASQPMNTGSLLARASQPMNTGSLLARAGSIPLALQPRRLIPWLHNRAGCIFLSLQPPPRQRRPRAVPTDPSAGTGMHIGACGRGIRAGVRTSTKRRWMPRLQPMMLLSARLAPCSRQRVCADTGRTQSAVTARSHPCSRLPLHP